MDPRPEGDAPGAPGGGEPTGPRPPGLPLSAQRLVRLAALFYGALFAAVLVWAGLAERSLLYASERGRSRGIDWAFDPAAGALAAAIVILLSGELTRRTRWGRDLALALGALLGRLPLRTCLLLAALSAVAEESFFRGALQPQVGIFWASLLFGAVHFVPRRELLPWTPFTIAAGFLLGGLFECTGNLVAPVVAHAVVNAVNLRVIALRYAPEP